MPTRRSTNCSPPSGGEHRGERGTCTGRSATQRQSMRKKCPPSSVRRTGGNAKRAIRHCKTGVFATQNGPFGSAVWPVWHMADNERIMKDAVGRSRPRPPTSARTGLIILADIYSTATAEGAAGRGWRRGCMKRKPQPAQDATTTARGWTLAKSTQPHNVSHTAVNHHQTAFLSLKKSKIQPYLWWKIVF